jgi:hypothetical protein
MFVDFGMAAQYDGVCYLRYDDTNPAAEKLEYIEHIQVGQLSGEAHDSFMIPCCVHPYLVVGSSIHD